MKSATGKWTTSINWVAECGRVLQCVAVLSWKLTCVIGWFTYETWLFHMCDVPDLRSRHDSFKFVIWLIHTCDMTDFWEVVYRKWISHITRAKSRGSTATHCNILQHTATYCNTVDRHGSLHGGRFHLRSFICCVVQIRISSHIFLVTHINPPWPL